MMTPEEGLAEAAKLLEQRGWGQHRFEDEDGRLCVRGALEMVAVDRWQMMEALAAELGFVDSFSMEIERKISRWNDAPGRTAEEVITTLRNAKRWVQA